MQRISWPVWVPRCATFWSSYYAPASHLPLMKMTIPKWMHRFYRYEVLHGGQRPSLLRYQGHMSQFSKERVAWRLVPCKSAEIHVTSTAWPLLLFLVLLASVFTSSTADHCRWHGGSHVLRQQADSAFINDKELAGFEFDEPPDGMLSLEIKVD